MAFDFERYLQAYEPESADLRSRHQISLSSDEEDILPVGKNDLLTSKDGRTTCLPFSSSSAENEEKSRLLDALSWLNQSEPRRRLGLERIESRFRSHQDSDGSANPKQGSVMGPPGNRHGLSKQKSLPASFSSEKAKSETRRRRRSSVRFADEIGENLTTFLMIPSRFDDADAAAEKQTTNVTSSRNPAPTADDQRNNRTDDHNRLSLKSSAADSKTSDDDDADQTPLFQLCFDQPAANFSEFRRRLSLQFVCLENARIEVKPKQTTDGLLGGHGLVVCSIKVRNIHPVKRVFARCTDNAWSTYADISAAYVSDGTNTCCTGHGNEFDTFSFALSNPLRSRVNRNAVTEGKGEEGKEAEEEGAYSRKTAAVEFALCYQVLGTKYWDNNDGMNYKIIWM